MKHHLSSFRRSPWTSIACLLILGLMFAPLGLMAVTTSPTTPLAPLGGLDPVAAGMLGIGAVGGILRSQASEHGDGGGGKAPEQLDLAKAVAQIEDKTLPISQRLSVAVQALKGIDPTQQLADVKQQLTDAQATVAKRDSEITRLKSELETAQKTLAAREKDVTDLEAANANLESEAKDLRSKEQDLKKRSEAKATEKIAALGFPASKLPGSQSQEQSKSLPENQAALEQELKSCKTQKERSALLRSYQEARA